MYDDAIKALNRDAKLKKIITHVGPCTIRTISDPFEALVDGIITQQISDSAGKAISSRFCDLFGKRFPKPTQVVQTTTAKLRSAGLSKMKAEYILNISQMIVSGKLDFASLEDMSDEEVISELIKIRGIGRWTAQMYLIFGLGRLDVLPMGDLGLINGIKRLYGLDGPSTTDIIKITDRWSPYRTIGTWYIWRGVKDFQHI